MVTATFSMDEGRRIVRLEVSGHAMAAEKGQDILCASASILAYTLAQNMLFAHHRGKLRHNPKIKIESGDFSVEAKAKDDETYAEILSTYIDCQTGYALLAQNYPDNVSVKLLGQGQDPSK